MGRWRESVPRREIGRAGRQPAMNRSRILREVHEIAVSMHRSGDIDKQTTHEFDVLARPQDRPTIAEIRERLAGRSAVTPRTAAAEVLRCERKIPSTDFGSRAPRT